MPRIKKIQENEATVYPVTIPEAIVLPDTREKLSDILSRIDSAINDKVDSTAIVDNLDTEDATSPLSAKQGRVLAAIKQDSLASGDGISIVNDVISVRFNKSDDDIAGPDSNGAYTLKDRTYNSLNPNGLGYVILKKKFSFASQVSQENTIYEIRHDFSLGGETVTIPTGCILKFVGGKLTNGTIVFDHTQIEGDAKILCDFSGTITGLVNCGWFGATPDESAVDNGVIINKVASVFKAFVLDPGAYYFSTPIIMSNVKTVNLPATLHFNGTVQDASLVTVSGCNYADINILRIIADDSSIVYTDTDNTNCVGFDFVNSNDCRVKIGRIQYVNTGFRFNGDGAGCSYNRVDIGDIIKFNYGIRFYQDNGGWVNENTVTGVRLAKEQRSWNPDNTTIYPIYLCGPLTASDTYDKVNSLSFNECSAEHFGCVIYARNTSYCNINRMRCEASPTIIKFVGRCDNNNFIDSGYGYNAETLKLSYFDLSEATSYPFSELSSLRRGETTISISTENKTISSSVGIAVDGFSAYKTSSSSDPAAQGDFLIGSYYIGAIVAVAAREDRLVIGRATQGGRFVVLPIEATIDGVTVTDYDTLKQYVPITAGGGAFAWNASEKIFKVGADSTRIRLYVPSPITKYFIGYQAKADTTVDFVLNRLTSSLQTYVRRYGASSSRPTNALGTNETGLIYFDTTLGQPIYWTGSSWVDSSGASV